MGATFSFSDPYPYYASLRESNPIYQDELGIWYITRYQDVAFVLSDERFLRQPFKKYGYVHQNEKVTLIDEIISKWSLFCNPPQHTQLREMLSHLINPRFIKNTKVVIESIVQSLVMKMLEKSECNFMQEFAYPLPVSVINHLLDTQLDVATVRKWSFAVATAMDHGSEEELDSVSPTVFSMYETLREIVIGREQHVGADWISKLIRFKDIYQLSTDDIVSNVIFLLLAAHETLQLTLGLGLITLLKNPDQLTLLQNNMQFIPSAIEEILRYDAPWNKLSRWTSKEVMVGNTVIPANQLVVVLINSANRDPERFQNPNRFDIRRTNNRHFAFSHGIHLCQGALLARLEMQTAFSQLVPILNRITLMEEKVEWFPNSSLRYISNLMIKIDKS